MLRFVLTFALACLAVLPACHHDPEPVRMSEADLPPLPPSSGTPVGYLIDNKDQLKLSPDQLAKLKNIDSSLAARDAEIDTQLRELQPKSDPDEDKKHQGEEHHNNAPGASGPPTGNEARLHELRNHNDREALRQAFALLDATQQATAKHILEDRGVAVPGEAPKPQATSDEGTPVPGLDQQ